MPLSIEKGDFSWEGVDGYPILRNINVKVDSGSLVAVVGPVGSGKSSLISAFLGEMYKLSGSVNTNVSTDVIVAYEICYIASRFSYYL